MDRANDEMERTKEGAAGWTGRRTSLGRDGREPSIGGRSCRDIGNSPGVRHVFRRPGAEGRGSHMEAGRPGRERKGLFGTSYQGGPRAAAHYIYRPRHYFGGAVRKPRT